MFNHKRETIMKNVLYKFAAFLSCCTMVFLFIHIIKEKTDRQIVHFEKPKAIDIAKLNSYANEEEMELAIAYKDGFIKKCEALGKETPTRIGNYLILKKVDITDQLITFSYQFLFDKSKFSESKWNDFIVNSKESTKTEMLSSTKEILADYNLSLSKVFELANIKLEYLLFDIKDTLIATFQLDYIDFYGM